MSIESRLKKILGEDYGGPALGWNGQRWEIYKWYDAPCGTDILGAGSTIKEAIDNYEGTIKARKKLKGKGK